MAIYHLVKSTPTGSNVVAIFQSEDVSKIEDLLSMFEGQFRLIKTELLGPVHWMVLKFSQN